MRAVITGYHKRKILCQWIRCILYQTSNIPHSPRADRDPSGPEFLDIIPSDPVSILLLSPEPSAAPYNRAAGMKHRCITTQKGALAAPRSNTAADPGSMACLILRYPSTAPSSRERLRPWVGVSSHNRPTIHLNMPVHEGMTMHCAMLCP